VALVTRQDRAMSGSRCLRSTLAAAPVLFSYAVVTEIEICIIIIPVPAGGLLVGTHLLAVTIRMPSGLLFHEQDCLD
jgi:hypothetical protein